MSTDDFHYATLTTPAPRQFGQCADCAAGTCAPQRGRRLFTGLLGGGLLLPSVPAWAREGVEVGEKSKFVGLVSADQIEKAGAQQYLALKQEAAQKRNLAPEGQPQLIRLREIASRIIPFSYEWNERARRWRWEVTLLGDPTLNAFCMPGGKIAFYYGILEQLKLEDDEVAAIMGHEVAHALREHARERGGKSMFKQGVVELGAALLGAGNLGRAIGHGVGDLVLLKYDRGDESEADLIGIELAARAGYDPAAAVRLWHKMSEASKGAPPQWLSTHPSNDTRIRDLEANLPKVAGLYARADKPARRFPVAPPLKRG